jgi:hypothetical protein
MSDQAPAPETGGTVGISVQMLLDRKAALEKVGASITAASGNDSAARKAIVDSIMDANSEQIDKAFTSLMTQLNGLNDDLLIGLLAKLEEAQKGDLKTKTDTVITERVKANAGDEVNVDALKEQWKSELELFRALKIMLKSLGQPVDDIEEPRRAGGRAPGSGSTTKTGMNKEGYRYFMDGKGRPVSQNSFSSLAFYATNGLDEAGNKVADGVKSKMSSKGLRAVVDAALKEKGEEFGKTDTWEVTLNNGTKIGARRLDKDVDSKDGFVFDAPSDGEPEAETPAGNGTATDAEPALTV